MRRAAFFPPFLQRNNSPAASCLRAKDTLLIRKLFALAAARAL